MIKTTLQFSELLDTVRRGGFELVDAGLMPVNEPFEMAAEDDNLMAEQVHVTFRDVVPDERRTVLADVQAGEEIFYVMGSARAQGELENLLRGVPAEHAEPHR